ncbi:Alpha/Beta hydrolase protein [Apiospora arundinis]|uniref:Alpha/Beta hydrolase protein n=1 Tax=Apiospora arundinis TaxID=335852 RepID=A0ABR2IJN4_9PEZI
MSNTSIATIWSSQPYRALYTVGFVFFTIPHLLYLSLRYAIPPLRSVPHWSWRVSIGAAMLRALFRYVAATRNQQFLTKFHGKCEGRYALIQPPDAALFRGALGAPAAAAKPAPVEAVWHPAALMIPGGTTTTTTTTAAATDGSGPRRHRVIVYASGGALVLGSDPDVNAKVVLDIATENFGATHVLCMQYRPASDEHPFPAAVQDFFTTYQHVLDLGVAPGDIVFMGDSAGGNIVLAALRYLALHDFPQPAGAAVFSPWVDVTVDGVQKYSQSIAPRYDILDAELLEWGVEAYRPKGKTLTTEEEGYVAPVNHPFRLATRLFIDSGSMDGFYESISIFARQMADIEGNQVRFHTGEGLPHDYFLTYPVLGTKDEACAVLREAREFISG